MAEDIKQVLISDLPELLTADDTDYLPIIHGESGLETTYKVKVSTIRAVELKSTLLAGDTELVFTDDNITDNCKITPYTTVYNVSPTDIVQANNTLTLTFNAQSTDIGVIVLIT